MRPLVRLSLSSRHESRPLSILHTMVTSMIIRNRDSRSTIAGLNRIMRILSTNDRLAKYRCCTIGRRGIARDRFDSHYTQSKMYVIWRVRCSEQWEVSRSDGPTCPRLGCMCITSRNRSSSWKRLGWQPGSTTHTRLMGSSSKSSNGSRLSQFFACTIRMSQSLSSILASQHVCRVIWIILIFPSLRFWEFTTLYSTRHLWRIGHDSRGFLTYRVMAEYMKIYLFSPLSLLFPWLSMTACSLAVSYE